MEEIIIKLNIRNEPKLMCIVTDIVSNVNLVNKFYQISSTL